VAVSSISRSVAHFFCPDNRSENADSEATKLLRESDLLTEQTKQWVMFHKDCSQEILERLNHNGQLTQDNLEMIFTNSENVQQIAVGMKLLDESNVWGSDIPKRKVLKQLFANPKNVNSTLLILVILYKANLLNDDTLLFFALDDLDSVAMALVCLSNRELLTLVIIHKLLMWPGKGNEFAEPILEQDQRNPLTQQGLSLLFEQQPGYTYYGPITQLKHNLLHQLEQEGGVYHEPNFIDSLRKLHRKDSLNAITRQVLCRYPNDVDNICSFAKKLMDADILRIDTLEAMLLHPADWEGLYIAFAFLDNRNLLNAKTCKMISITPSEARSMAEMIAKFEYKRSFKSSDSRSTARTSRTCKSSLDSRGSFATPSLVF